MRHGWAVRPVQAEKIDLRGRSILVDAQIGHGGLKRTKTGDERKVDLSARLASVLAAAVARPKPVATTKVVPITGEQQAAQKAQLGPWLFYPDLRTTSRRRRRAWA